MGIQGLLPYLKKISKEANIKDFRGCTVAIDSYCWLHKGAFACAEKLAQGIQTDQYVYYCMKFVNFLLSEGLKPIMVFDGCHLPSKKEVEKARRERRETYRKKATQLLREGKASEARDCWAKCVDITSQMALDLMNACRDKGVDCIVAPYEADAQLAYLNKIGVAQIIITEDSDLLLFGCEKVMFKMDHSGNGILVEKRHLSHAMDIRPDCYSFEKFRYMCVLSGCDYLPSLPGIGLAKANKVFKITKQTDMNLVLKKLPSTLNMSNLVVPTEYITGFHRANNTFLYQLVFNPLRRELVPLTAYPPEVQQEVMDYAGPSMSSSKALQIALGNIDINTGQQIADFNPDNFKPKSQSWSTSSDRHRLSIWDKNYQPMSRSFEAAPCETTNNNKAREVKVTLLKFVKKAIVPKRPREEDEPSQEELLATYNNPDSMSAAKRSRPIQDPEDILPIGSKVSQKNAQVLSYQEECPSESDLDGGFVLKSPLKSPNSKNIFSVDNQSAKKERFDVNISRKKEIKIITEVKSRFFKEKQPMKPTNFFGQLNLSHENVEKCSDDDCDETESETMTTETTSDMDDSGNSENHNSQELELSESQKMYSQTGKMNLGSQSESISPHNSFGFSKKTRSNILGRFRNSTDNSTSKPFKPVLPRNGSLESVINRSSSSDTLNGSINEMNSSQLSPDGQAIKTLYSIHPLTEQQLNSQESEKTEDKEDIVVESSPLQSTSVIGSSYFTGTNNSSTGTLSNFKRKSSLSGFYQRASMELGGKSKEEKTTSKDLLETPKNLMKLGGIKRHGLSKSVRKSTSSKENGPGKIQPAISNFFNNFALDKNCDKLVSSKEPVKPLSPHKDNVQVEERVVHDSFHILQSGSRLNT